LIDLDGLEYVEMNVGILSKESRNEDDWSSDSDPDSPLGSSDLVSSKIDRVAFRNVSKIKMV